MSMPVNSMPPTNPRGISVIVPVYNSRGMLKELAQRLIRVLGKASYRFEILLVNDGSSDDSWDLIQGLAAFDERIKGVDLLKNAGQINALMCGFKQAQYPWALTIDDDLQHPPEEIPKMLSLMETGRYDVVFGIYDEKKDNWFKSLGSASHHFFYERLFRKPRQIKLSSFRVIASPLLERLRKIQGPLTLLHPILLEMTQAIGNVTVRHDPRGQGRSGYSLVRLLKMSAALFVSRRKITQRESAKLEDPGFVIRAQTQKGVGIS